MKRIFIAFLILISFYSCSYGEENISLKLNKLEREIETLSRNVAKLSERLDRIEANNRNYYNDLREKFSFRGDLVFHLGLTINALLIGMPFLLVCLGWYQESREAKRKKALTLEDVEKVFYRLLTEAKSKGAI